MGPQSIDEAPGAAEDVVVGLLGRWLELPPRVRNADRIAAFLATSSAGMAEMGAWYRSLGSGLVDPGAPLSERRRLSRRSR